jgi:hypothetical protein
MPQSRRAVWDADFEVTRPSGHRPHEPFTTSEEEFMDPLDIIAQWRRDIAMADNGDDDATQPLRDDVSATTGVDGQHGLTTENDEPNLRTGTIDKE